MIAPAQDPGARWVERYLLPLLRARLRMDQGTVRCLQIEPDDETEARRLREHGYACDTLFLESAQHASGYDVSPLRACGEQLPCGDATYDLVWSGRLGKVARSRRGVLAHELARVCRPGGAVLVGIGNRLCPVDLTGNAAKLHGPREPALLSLAEVQHLFVDEAGFRAVTPLSARMHLGWGRGGAVLRLLSGPVEAYWTLMSAFGNRALYASPFNPLLMLWIER